MAEGESKEDYLRIIYELGGKQVKAVDIAKNLNISKPSVSEMIKKLIKARLVQAKSYGKIFLTKQGIIEAKKISHRYHTIRKFATNILKHSDDKAHEIAHKLEHHFSHESVNKLNNFIEENLPALYKIKEIEKESETPSYIS